MKKKMAQWDHNQVRVWNHEEAELKVGEMRRYRKQGKNQEVAEAHESQKQRRATKSPCLNSQRCLGFNSNSLRPGYIPHGISFSLCLTPTLQLLFCTNQRIYLKPWQTQLE